MLVYSEVFSNSYIQILLIFFLFIADDMESESLKSVSVESSADMSSKQNGKGKFFDFLQAIIFFKS